MRALIDTHVLLWWLSDDKRLSPRHRTVIADSDNEVFVSAVTVAEISIKASLGKLTVPDGLVQTIAHEGFSALPLTADHAEALRELPWHHRDPFDRMLVAQASVEQFPLLSSDARLGQYAVEIVA